MVGTFQSKEVPFGLAKPNFGMRILAKSFMKNKEITMEMIKKNIMETFDEKRRGQRVLEGVKWKYKSSAREAAVCIPVCCVKGKPSILFTLRSSNLREHNGEVSFPGGKRDPEDADLIETCRREVREEVFLEFDRKSIYGPFIDLPSKSGHKVSAFIGLVDGNLTPSQVRFNSDEVAKVFSVDIEHLLDTREMEVFRETKKSIPAWNVVLDESGTCTAILQPSSQLVEPSGMRGSYGENRSVMEDFGSNAVRIWGLTGYILGAFLRDVVLKAESLPPKSSL